MTLQQMTPSKYQSVLNSLSSQYSQNTLNNFHYPIKNAVKAAVREHILKEDFTEGAIVKSSLKKKPVDEKFLEVDEYLHLIEVSKERFSTQSYFLIYLLAVTDLRFAEALGLTWNDVDFKRGLLSVTKTWNSTVTHDFAPTKNQSSVREVPVSDTTLAVLRDYKANHWQENERNRIICDLSNTATNKVLKHIVGRNVHCHSLRHTYVSYLITEGVDLMAISRILGHQNLNITLSVYAHRLEALKEKNYGTIKNLFEVL